MALAFKLPDLGEGLTEAEIVKWLVKAGDNVEEGQAFVQVETDKAVIEIPSPRKGVILQWERPRARPFQWARLLSSSVKPERKPKSRENRRRKSEAASLCGGCGRTGRGAGRASCPNRTEG